MQRLLLQKFILVIALLCLQAGAAWSSDKTKGQWELYPSFHADFRSDLDPNSQEDASNTAGTLAFLYEREFGSFSFLGEAYASDDEGAIERYKLGWKISDAYSLWVGRFYNPVGYWNTEYHHGVQNEQSIHRPSIVEYEINGGIIPTSMVGTYLEGKSVNGDLSINYILAVGKGPELTEEGELEAYNLGDSQKSGSAKSLTAKLGFQIKQPFILKTGLFVNHNTISSRMTGITDVEQSIFGGYFHSEWASWILTWEMYSISNTVETPSARNQFSFTGGYAQVGYRFDQYWVGFIRVEDIEGSDSDAYLALFPNYIIDRNLVGLRLNFRKDQAVTFGILDSALVTGSHVHTAVQWSAKFQR